VSFPLHVLGTHCLGAGTQSPDSRVTCIHKSIVAVTMAILGTSLPERLRSLRCDGVSQPSVCVATNDGTLILRYVRVAVQTKEQNALLTHRTDARMWHIDTGPSTTAIAGAHDPRNGL